MHKTKFSRIVIKLVIVLWEGHYKMMIKVIHDRSQAVAEQS